MISNKRGAVRQAAFSSVIGRYEYVEGLLTLANIAGAHWQRLLDCGKMEL
jgi:hypothetical protein